MRRRFKTLPLVTLRAAALVLLACAGVHACEPCGSTLDLRRSLERAEVVAVVKRPERPRQPEEPSNGPACDELLVERVLKGKVEGERLAVRSWYGMCPYGIILGEGTYVVILAGASSSDYDAAEASVGCDVSRERKSGLYAPVEHGCAVRSLRVEAGAVEAEGVKLTLDEFRDKYGLGEGAARGE